VPKLGLSLVDCTLMIMSPVSILCLVFPSRETTAINLKGLLIHSTLLTPTTHTYSNMLWCLVIMHISHLNLQFLSMMRGVSTILPVRSIRTFAAQSCQTEWRRVSLLNSAMTCIALTQVEGLVAADNATGHFASPSTIGDYGSRFIPDATVQHSRVFGARTSVQHGHPQGPDQSQHGSPLRSMTMYAATSNPSYSRFDLPQVSEPTHSTTPMVIADVHA
jgi:hypothetical protein